MKKRTYLKHSVSLCKKGDRGFIMREFRITKKVGEGASVVCYEAYHNESGRGILKEFYPRDNYGYSALERNDLGQLIPPTELQPEYKRYQEEKQRYLESYDLLLLYKQDSDGQELTTFIPSFEIYNGCDENENVLDTVYVWMPDQLETFEKICSEIHKNPAVHPEAKLYTVLHALQTLTRCISILHDKGMIHRDIKPSNFGFVKRGDETLTQSLSLFDVDSICLLGDACKTVAVSEGYTEPEIEQGISANIQTDVYSIGATLFHAIAVTKKAEEKKYRYQSDYYDKLSSFVEESKLLRASETTKHPKLREILTKILQKCLSDRENRYDDCEGLLKDLDAALQYILPPQYGDQWILEDAEKAFEKQKDAFLSILYHLYERPLYERLSANEEAIRVLVVGFGSHGQKFLDACLQAGQNINKNLQVTVVAKNDEEQNTYLQSRPALKAFFAINGASAPKKSSYGSILFEKPELNAKDNILNADVAADYLTAYKTKSQKSPHYIFIALDNDQWNSDVADICSDTFKNCSVNYICALSRPSKNSKADKSLPCPLYINEKPQNRDVSRMAFNTHLVWTKGSNLDYGTIQKSFRERYNYESCVAHALSLKYKLHDCGINLEKNGFEKSAERFERNLEIDQKKTLLNRLMWLEHRRWVTEKICQGWQTLPVENYEGETKDKEKKLHICLVRSEPNQKLPEPAEQQFEEALKSDVKGNSNANLDELDSVSLELHKKRVELAAKTKQKNLLAGEELLAIRSLVQNHQASLIAFQEWFTCLKELWDGDRQKIHLYEGLKNALLKATKQLDNKDNKEEAEEKIKTFDRHFAPIVASMEHRNWKNDDVALIENIPFILTYTKNAKFVIPYATGYQKDRGPLNNDALFGNVAAPTALNPGKILYLYLAETEEDLKRLKDSLPHVMAYMRKKQLQAKVEFLIITELKNIIPKNEDENSLKKQLAGIDPRIIDVKYHSPETMRNLPAELNAYFVKEVRKQKNLNQQFLAFEKNDTDLSRWLRHGGFYDDLPENLPHYRFDSKKMEFDSPKIRRLLPIGKSPFITVTDMIALAQSSSASSNPPEFYADYQKLWDEYQKNSKLWKDLCTSLKNHLNSQERIAIFKNKNENTSNVPPSKITLTYILPAVCSKSVAKLLSLLAAEGCINEESGVTARTSDSCAVTIVYPNYSTLKPTFDKIFADVYKLTDPDALTVQTYASKSTVDVRIDGLTVSGFTPSDIKKNNKNTGNNGTGNNGTGNNGTQGNLLITLSQWGFLINLTQTNNVYSFTFASKQIKELLSCEGKILEVYTFHKIKESGYFDDVVSSFEVFWGSTTVKNEFDCVATKGFRSLFIECKATRMLDSDYTFKLKQLTDQFGINAIPILIGDTQEKDEENKNVIENNTEKRKQGKMSGLTIVSNEADIGKIDKTLKKILNGKYGEN